MRCTCTCTCTVHTYNITFLWPHFRSQDVSKSPKNAKFRACVAFCGESGLWSVAEVWIVLWSNYMVASIS